MSTAPDPADHDLDLAVELVNTYWVLASPPDRLTGIGAYQRILREAGEDALAGQLGPADLPGLRGLRDSLHPVFAAGPAADAVALVDTLLREAAVPARLTTAAQAGDGSARWDWGAGQQGLAALRSRLVAALAAQLIRSGTSRLGVCQAAPCTCVYVDRSRARTRRYCCDQCNDRAAAAAYRRRHLST
jgi:predicted RNA-binding Zn ribbon-like protein